MDYLLVEDTHGVWVREPVHGSQPPVNTENISQQTKYQSTNKTSVNKQNISQQTTQKYATILDSTYSYEAWILGRYRRDSIWRAVIAIPLSGVTGKGRGRYFPLICSSAFCHVHGIGAWELGKLAQGNLRYLPTYNTLIGRKHLITLFLNIKPISKGVGVKCFAFCRKVDVKW